jgi:hypothetical protein
MKIEYDSPVAYIGDSGEIRFGVVSEIATITNNCGIHETAKIQEAGFMDGNPTVISDENRLVEL